MTANEKLDDVDYVPVRRAGVLLGGKAPGTVKSLVIAGRLEAKTSRTEGGHPRLLIATASIRRLLEEEASAAPKAA